MPISTLNVNAKLNVKVCNESLYLLKIHTDLEASDSFSLIAVEISFVPMHKGAKESKRQPQSYPLLQLISTHDGYHHFSREVGMPCLVNMYLQHSYRNIALVPGKSNCFISLIN